MSPRLAAVVAVATAAAFVGAFSKDLHDQWRLMRWLHADAVILGPPLRGPPDQRRGPTYTVTLQARLPTGETVTAISGRPLFESIRAPSPTEPGWRRIAPREGDPVSVMVNPSDHRRMIPTVELRRANPVVALAIHLLVFGLLSSLLYAALRRYAP